MLSSTYKRKDEYQPVLSYLPLRCQCGKEAFTKAVGGLMCLECKTFTSIDQLKTLYEKKV